MKKIYMILAAMTLLSLSLNAQVRTTSHTPLNLMKGSTSGVSAIVTPKAGGQHKAPMRVNLGEGEYLFGPYDTDDFSSTGVSLQSIDYTTSTSEALEVYVGIPRAEFQSHVGDTVKGFRFAVTQNIRVFDFTVYGEGPNHYLTSIFSTQFNSGNYSTYAGNQWLEFTFNNPFEFQVPDSITTIWMGYGYWQYNSTTGTGAPIGQNPNSTGHEEMAYSNYYGNFYEATNLFSGDLAVQLIMKSSTPKTATPVITYEVTATSVIITATGNGTVTLSAGGQTATGNGTASVTIPRTTEDQVVTATATAQEADHLVSDPATQQITIPEAGRSPMPTINMTDNGDGTYTITVTGTGQVALYINDAEHGGTAGDPVATGQGSVSITVEEHSIAMTLPVQATNQEGDLAISRTAEATYNIPAMTIDNTFTVLDPQPANASTPIKMESMMFVDRFSKVIPIQNNHPRWYYYTLEETQVRQRTSNAIPVEVKHTGSDGLGFYTLTQIDNDLERKLKMDVRNAAIDLPLENDPGVFFYTAERSTAAFPDQADRKYFGVLQRTSDGNYTETLNPSYDYDSVYIGGQHHIHLDMDTITGQYNQYLTYVPVVWTMGFDRVLYETDHEHNSYGAPKWKTGVADVQLNAVSIERQESASTTWMDGSDKVSMYMMTVDATGVMPTVNTMPYEPYMFRVFVESKNGKLRNWTYVPENVEAHVGSHFEGVAGAVTGPLTVWSEYMSDSLNTSYNEAAHEVYFVKNKAEQYDSETGAWDVPGNMNILFAALDDLTTEGQGENERVIEDDLKIYVRFYYIVKGSAANHIHGLTLRDGGEAPAGYGSEGQGTPPAPRTGVSELFYYGDVVSTTYYNVQGMKSDKPFDGINIVVTRYSNGTTSTTKIVR